MSKKDRPVTEEEKTIWRYVTRNDKKLHEGEEEAAFDIDAYASKQRDIEVQAKPKIFEIPEERAKELHLLRCGEYAGVDKSTAEKFRKGKLSVDRKLDLHGMTLMEATDAVQIGIQDAYHDGVRVMLVITGKGKEGAGVLKNNLPFWMNTATVRPIVLAFDEATPKDGGSGAYYVLLKRRK